MREYHILEQDLSAFRDYAAKATNKNLEEYDCTLIWFNFKDAYGINAAWNQDKHIWCATVAPDGHQPEEVESIHIQFYRWWWPDLVKVTIPVSELEINAYDKEGIHLDFAEVSVKSESDVPETEYVTVTFMDTLSDSETPYRSVTVEKGETLSQEDVPSPEHDGQDFLGWYEENTEEKFAFDQPVQQDATLYSRYEPSGTLQTVYVYVDATGATGGTANAHNYFTIGTIQLKIKEQPSEDFNNKNGTNLYEGYKTAIAEALKSIDHKYNRWLTLSDVEWTLLHADNGADDYVPAGTWVWHLDGKIKEVPSLYTVTYHANNGVTPEMTHEDPSSYKEGAEVTVLGNMFENGDKVFQGWATTADADGKIQFSPGQKFTMGKANVDLYAVWGDSITTGTLTVNKIVEGGVALPNDFKILVKDNSGQTLYTLELGAATQNNDGTYTWTISNVAPGIYTIDEENALVNGYDLTSNANPASVVVRAGSTSSVNVTNTYKNAPDNTASFSIKKVESGTTNGLDGAVFHICTNVDCDGTCENGWSVTTAAGGLAMISGLKSGTTYYLRETVAPKGYELGNTVYKITVAGQHEKQSTGVNIFSYLWKLVASVFVGTEDNAAAVVKDQQGNFLIPNEKSPTGTLKITKTGAGSVAVGSDITYTITVNNPGEYAVENVMVTDTLDTKLTYVASDNGGVYDTATRMVTWNVGTLAAGASEVLTVTATANETGTVENIAYVDYTGNGDPISSTTVTTTVTGGTSPSPSPSPSPTPTTSPSNPPYVPGDDDDDEPIDIPEETTPLNPSPEPSDEPIDIPEETTPLDPGTDIPEETIPLDPGPVDPVEPEEEITEGETPLGNLPQTGAVAAPVNPAVTMGLMALAFSMAGCGLYFTFGRKKGEEED